MVGRDEYNNNDSNINIINNVSHHVAHPYSMSIDSGATTHAFTKENTGINNDMVHINLPFSNITKTPNGVKVMYPDGNTAQATHEAVLNLPILPIAARKVRTVPYWDWSETPTTEEPISKSAMIEMILKGESIRQMLTCESIGKHESQHRHRRSKETAPQIKPTHCNSIDRKSVV